ncbi:hypothetical protein D3C71_1728580 [compost metagenome]
MRSSSEARLHSCRMAVILASKTSLRAAQASRSINGNGAQPHPQPHPTKDTLQRVLDPCPLCGVEATEDVEIKAGQPGKLEEFQKSFPIW